MKSGAPPPLGGLKIPPKVESVSPISKQFLIEMECWNFRCGLRPPFCMNKAFSNFLNRVLLSPSGLPESIWPPQKSNSLFIMWFWLNLKHDIFICLPIIIEIIIFEWRPLLPDAPSTSSPLKQSNFYVWCDFAKIWYRTFSFQKCQNISEHFDTDSGQLCAKKKRWCFTIFCTSWQYSLIRTYPWLWKLPGMFLLIKIVIN